MSKFLLQNLECFIKSKNYWYYFLSSADQSAKARAKNPIKMWSPTFKYIDIKVALNLGSTFSVSLKVQHQIRKRIHWHPISQKKELWKSKLEIRKSPTLPKQIAYPLVAIWPIHFNLIITRPHSPCFSFNSNSSKTNCSKTP